MDNGYLLSDIVIDGIEPSEDWKRLMEQERRGEVTAEEVEKATQRQYRAIPNE